MKIAIMTDVNAGLDYVGYDTGIVCLRSTINFPNELPLVDGIDIKANEFYERIQKITKSSEIPSTSAPSVANIYDELDKLVNEGFTDVIHYPISFELSSTGKTVQQIAAEYEEKIKIHVVNTKTATYVQGYIALEAKKMADVGCSVEEIIDYSNYLINNNQAYFVVNDLNYLVKNGRLSNASAFLGSLFKIKPILEISKEGKIQSIAKVKTSTKAYDKIIELLLDFIKNKKCIIFALHSLNQEGVNYIINKIKEVRKDIDDIEIHYITPAVGAHIGVGIAGVAAFILK